MVFVDFWWKRDGRGVEFRIFKLFAINLHTKKMLDPSEKPYKFLTNPSMKKIPWSAPERFIRNE